MKQTFIQRLAMAGLILGAVLPMAGCATYGQEFNLSKLAQIHPGVTTKTEVLALVGEAPNQETSTFKKDLAGAELKQPIVATIYQYSFSAPNGSGASPWVQPNKWANVIMVDDVVVAYLTSSSFKDNSTDFDASKAGGFEQGKTTKEDVVKTLGNPSGQGIYPFAASSKGSTYFYSTDLRNLPPGSRTRKRVQTFFNERGLLEDISVSVNTEALPVVPVATPITVYIPPPVKR